MASIWIDSDRKIVKADALWDELATTNDSFELTGKQIQGRVIWTFINGDPARMFLDAIITRVNVSEKPYVLNYRCDGPKKARQMRMMVSKDGDLFRIDHEIVWTEPISPRLLFKETSDADEERCAICGKVHFDGGWYDALVHRRVFGTMYELKTRSVVCPTCEDKVPQPEASMISREL